MLEYFAPLQDWLKQQNEGQVCGWQALATPGATTPTAATEPPAAKKQ